MNRKLKWMSITAGFAVLIGTLSAKPPVVNPQEEQEKYPDLQKTEDLLEESILQSYTRMQSFGHLVALVKEDRALAAAELEDKYDFRNRFRNVKYTPRNTYIRFVKESPEFLLVGFGELDQINEETQKQLQLAQEAGLQIQAPQFGNREGVELTQFEFIYDPDSPKRVAIGSIRKSLTLFVTPGQNEADAEQEVKVSAVVTKLVEDDFKQGIRNIELVYDPSPDTKEMEDVVIYHRYNYKVPNVVLLPTMNNTANYPHRIEFKRKFYVKLIDHYNMLYRLVDGYARKDGNEYNEEVLDLLKKHTQY